MWPILNQLMGGHAIAYRATNGLVGHYFPGAPPVLLLDHVGARSGKRRTTPLVYLRDGADFVVVASKGGYPRNPAWFHNLRANPDVTIQVGPLHRAVRASVATPQERARLWPKVVDTYGGYAPTSSARSERFPWSSSNRAHGRSRRPQPPIVGILRLLGASASLASR